MKKHKIADIVVALLLSAATTASARSPRLLRHDGRSDPAAARRQALLAKLDKAVAVLPSQHFSARGPQDSNDFYYLAGFNEPGAALVLAPGADKPVTLFNRAGKWPEGARGAAPTPAPRPSCGRFSPGPSRRSRSSCRSPTSTGCPTGSARRIPSPRPHRSRTSSRSSGRCGSSRTRPRSRSSSRPSTSRPTPSSRSLKTAKPGDRELDINALIQYVYARREATISFSQVASGPEFGQHPLRRDDAGDGAGRRHRLRPRRLVQALYVGHQPDDPGEREIHAGAGRDLPARPRSPRRKRSSS